MSQLREYLRLHSAYLAGAVIREDHGAVTGEIPDANHAVGDKTVDNDVILVVGIAPNSLLDRDGKVKGQLHGQLGTQPGLKPLEDGL